MTPELLADICNKLASGQSLRSICREMGEAESTVRYWFQRDEAAFAQSTHARELGCDALADECLEIADDKTEDPSSRRVRIETRVRLIGKWSQRYSDKLLVKNETTVTHKHDLGRFSPDELDALERLVAKASVTEGDTGGEGATPAHKLH